MGLAASVTALLIGRPISLPAELLSAYPELGEARWRRGGLPPRIGGAFLGRRTVAGITLWRTVYVGTGVRLSAELLLHEIGHVRQFVGSPVFPLRYIAESVRRGYSKNRYEFDAQAFAEARLRDANHRLQDV
jgi:hypothetical protein